MGDFFLLKNLLLSKHTIKRFKKMKKIFALSTVLIAMFFSVNTFAETIPLDKLQFTRYAAAIVKKMKPESVVKIEDLLQLRVDIPHSSQDEFQYNLDRIYSLCQLQEGDCSDELNRFIGNLLDLYDQQNEKVDQNSIRLIIRSKEYLDGAVQALQVKDQAPDLTKSKIKSYPFVDGLVVLVVMDTPSAMRILTQNDIKELKKNDKAIYRLGLENIKKEQAPLAEVIDINLVDSLGYITGSVYDPSRVLFHDEWKTLAQAHQGKLIVAMPTTDLLFYIDDDSKQAIEALKKIVADTIMNSHNPLTDKLLKWNEKGWAVIE